MNERLKGTVPLALTIAVLAGIFTWATLNFNFHWLTDGDLGNGLELPKNFHLAIPAGFIAWGFYFAAGGGASGAGKVLISSFIGATGALVTMWLSGATAELPDLWSIALWVGIPAFVVVMLAALGDWYFVPAAFGGYASTLFWWIATGLDNWAPGGGGVGNSLEALGDPATAGAGAFGGVISTPFGWVYLNTIVTLALGVLFGLLTTAIVSAMTPKPVEAPVAKDEEVIDLTDDAMDKAKQARANAEQTRVE